MEEMNRERLDSTAIVDDARADGPPFIMIEHFKWCKGELEHIRRTSRASSYLSSRPHCGGTLVRYPRGTNT